MKINAKIKIELFRDSFFLRIKEVKLNDIDDYHYLNLIEFSQLTIKKIKTIINISCSNKTTK